MGKNESKNKKASRHAEEDASAINDESTATTEEASKDAEDLVLTAQQISEIKERVEEIEKERDEYLDTAKRVQADLENYRRRNASLRIDSLNEGKYDVFCELLPIIDNFERALLKAAEYEQNVNFIEGMDMIYRQLLTVLEKHGIETIEGSGEQFDPNIQQAVLQEESDGVESGIVLEVLQKGYRGKDGKMLRYSMVKVAQ